MTSEAPHSHKKKVSHFIKDEKYYCPACGNWFKLTKEPFHVHHVKLWSEGGLTESWNLVPLCEACHGILHFSRGERAHKMSVTLMRLMRWRYGLLFELQSQDIVNATRVSLADNPVSSLAEWREVNRNLKSDAFLKYLEIANELIPNKDGAWMIDDTSQLHP